MSQDFDHRWDTDVQTSLRVRRARRFLSVAIETPTIALAASRFPFLETL